MASAATEPPSRRDEILQRLDQQFGEIRAGVSREKISPFRANRMYREHRSIRRALVKETANGQDLSDAAYDRMDAELKALSRRISELTGVAN